MEPIPVCSGSISAFLLSHLSMLPLLVCLLFMSVLSGALCSSMQASCHLWLTSCSSEWTILELGGGDPWNSTSSTELFFFLRLYPMGFLQIGPCKRLKSFLKLRVWFVLFLPFRILHSMISWSLYVAKVVPDVCIPNQFFLVSNSRVPPVFGSSTCTYLLMKDDT